MILPTHTALSKAQDYGAATTARVDEVKALRVRGGYGLSSMPPSRPLYRPPARKPDAQLKHGPDVAAAPANIRLGDVHLPAPETEDLTAPPRNVAANLAAGHGPGVQLGGNKAKPAQRTGTSSWVAWLRQTC